MPAPTLKQLCPGVRATGDSLVYEVQSDSDPDQKWTVDKGAYWGFGACTCPHYQFNLQPLVRKLMPRPAFECKHIKAVNRYLAIEVAQQILQQRAAAANRNRKANGRGPARYRAEAPEY